MKTNTGKQAEGGRKYQAPENMSERRELADIMVVLDVPAFRKFVDKNIPALKEAGILDQSDDELVNYMHMFRSISLSMGDACFESRNFLRSKQFGYSAEEVATKPKCISCKWFRAVPESEEKACMHLGSLQEDICCPDFVS